MKNDELRNDAPLGVCKVALKGVERAIVFNPSAVFTVVMQFKNAGETLILQ